MRDPLLHFLLLSLLAEEASAEFIRQRSYEEPGMSIMPLEEWLGFREARGEERHQVSGLPLQIAPPFAHAWTHSTAV